MREQYESAFATLILDYKSGRRHVTETTVATARKRADEQVKKNALRYAKVCIPVPEKDEQIVCIWEPRTKWTRHLVATPKTKD